MNTANWYYFKLEELTPEIRKQNGLKPDTKNRLDCTMFHAPTDELRGLTFFVNNKGMMYFNLTPVKNIVDADVHRQASVMLTGKSVNFTSVYIDDIEKPCFAYGNPPQTAMLGKKTKKPNPLFAFKNDLYLFLIEENYKQVELFILPDQKNYWNSYILKLGQGDLNAEVQELREQAKPFFEYSL